jgi:hypothetical protein
MFKFQDQKTGRTASKKVSILDYGEFLIREFLDSNSASRTG